MNKHHNVTDLHFEQDTLVLTVDGTTHTFALKDISATLNEASEQQRNIFEISPSGYGIHWPLLDKDLSIDGLLGITHQPANQKEQV